MPVAPVHTLGAAYSKAVSSMSRVIGPGKSSVGLSGRTPNVPIRPIEAFNPVMPF